MFKMYLETTEDQEILVKLYLQEDGKEPELMGAVILTVFEYCPEFNTLVWDEIKSRLNDVLEDVAMEL